MKNEHSGARCLHLVRRSTNFHFFHGKKHYMPKRFPPLSSIVRLILLHLRCGSKSTKGRRDAMGKDEVGIVGGQRCRDLSRMNEVCNGRGCYNEEVYALLKRNVRRGIGQMIRHAVSGGSVESTPYGYVRGPVGRITSVYDCFAPYSTDGSKTGMTLFVRNCKIGNQ